MKRVAILEGDPLMADLLEEWLVSAGYATVVLDESSTGSLNLTERIDAVLADIALPRQAATRAITRLHAAFPKIPVVLMSGYFLTSPASSADEMARELGAAGILPKPFTRSALLNALARVLAQA